jgi:hypothetical protein
VLNAVAQRLSMISGVLANAGAASIIADPAKAKISLFIFVTPALTMPPCA